MATVLDGFTNQQRLLRKSLSGLQFLPAALYPVLSPYVHVYKMAEPPAVNHRTVAAIRFDNDRFFLSEK